MSQLHHQTIYIAYLRKSEEDQGRQILSLPAQRDWAVDTSARQKRSITKFFQDQKSAMKPYQRPGFDDMLKSIKRWNKRGVPVGIYTWKANRLARNPDEAGIVMGLLQRGEIAHIVANDREYRPEDNAIVSYVDFGMANQYSRDLSNDVKRGLEKKLNMGWRPSPAVLGYLNTKHSEHGSNTLISDPERFDLIARAFKLMLTGSYSLFQIQQIANKEWNLTTRPTRTRPARPICRSSWHRIFTNPFYYGWFEYPKRSGQWYQGKHQPMITKDEFDLLQEILGGRGRPREKKRTFDYTGIIRCGSCPAAVTAEEKVKRQKNGNVHRYVYYHCTKRVDPTCQERSIEVAALEGQVAEVLSKLQISEEFLLLALGYLERTKQLDTHAIRLVDENGMKRKAKIKRHLEALQLRYTAPENLHGELISDQDYVELKNQLHRGLVDIEQQLARQEEGSAHSSKLTKENFELCHHALERFTRGDRSAKRNTLHHVCSNLSLRDKMVHIAVRRPLKLIAERKSSVEREIAAVRTAKSPATKRQIGEKLASCPMLRGLVDDVRNHFLSDAA